MLIHIYYIKNNVTGSPYKKRLLQYLEMVESWIIKPDIIEHVEGIHMTMNALARYDCTTVC